MSAAASGCDACVGPAGRQLSSSPELTTADMNGGSDDPAVAGVNRSQQADPMPHRTPALYENVAQRMAERVAECMATNVGDLQRCRGDDLLKLLNVGTSQEWSSHRTMWRGLAEAVVHMVMDDPT